MSEAPFDLFVIGAGSGGVRAARMAAQRGARVAVAESGAFGGTCVNLGCIPKKLYSHAAHFADAFEHSRGFGWSPGEARFDWAALKANRAREVARLNGVYEGVLRGAGVSILRGRARLVAGAAVEVGGTVHAARRILVASGGHAVLPELPGGELAVSSDAMFDLPVFPRRLVVVGGGYIACEFASIFRGLGAEVTQLVRGEQILRGFDDDVRGFLARQMAQHGVVLRTGTRPAAIERTEGAASALRITLDDGSVLPADTVLMATGRRPNSAGLGLEALGVAIDERGAIRVDDGFETSVSGIHAIGDVIDRVQLTPVALAEAMVLVDRLFGDARRRIDYALVPTAVFTHPNVATVGLNEAQARERFAQVKVFRSEFKPLKHTLSGSAERVLMKLLVDADSDRVLGLHMVGDDAGEIVQGFATAMVAGATKAQFDATLGIHPTAAEEFVTMREPVA
jgi:glutathione reductase (NADPH)